MSLKWMTLIVHDVGGVLDSNHVLPEGTIFIPSVRDLFGDQKRRENLVESQTRMIPY